MQLYLKKATIKDNKRFADLSYLKHLNAVSSKQKKQIFLQN